MTTDSRCRHLVELLAPCRVLIEMESAMSAVRPGGALDATFLAPLRIDIL